MGKRLTPQEKTLDKWFSLYIRKRDTPGPCPTCGTFITFEESDCCHFISRDYHAVRWDERNANAGCRKCNRFQSGRQYEHGIYIAKKHGKDIPDLLLFKSKQPAHFSTEEIKAMSNRYRLMVKEGPF